VKRRVVTVTEFKAKCLAMLDEIGCNGGAITITKRGRPMAMVSPAPGRLKSSEGMWRGKVRIPPERLTADTSDLWEVLRRK
jgi:antitoxin (DNA-binding transcriptional repressor) of toxin-antitoxin stability system